VNLPSQLVDASVIAQRTGKSLTVVRSAIRQALAEGQSTLGPLRVVVERGRGRGGRRYLVDLQSLSGSYANAERFNPTASRSESRTFDKLTEWREHQVLKVLDLAREMSQKDAIESVCRTAIYPSGKKRGKAPSPLTVQAWVAEYRREGVAAVSRKVRRDKGEQSVITTRAIDRALHAKGHADEILIRVRAELEQLLKDLIGGRRLSRPQIQMYAKAQVKKILEPYGISCTSLRDPLLKLPDRLRIPAKSIICSGRSRSALPGKPITESARSGAG